jgi:hypothetical protein
MKADCDENDLMLLRDIEHYNIEMNYYEKSI